MRFIHTFYSKPLFENKFNKFETALKFVLTNYTLSAQYVKKFGHNIILYTDTKGKELLSFIPYDDIIVLKDIEHNKHFAAQFKFKALEHYQYGDVLIDGDCFLRKEEAFKKVADDKYDVIYSFFEPYRYTLQGDMPKYYTKLFSVLRKYKFESPYKLPKVWKDMGWMNTSLMKFNNLSLLHEYINQYNKHKELLKNANFEDTWPDIIIEQYFLTLLCKDKRALAMVEDFYYDKNDNQKALDLGFTHLGKAKVSQQQWVSDTLFKENPILWNTCRAKLKTFKIEL